MADARGRLVVCVTCALTVVTCGRLRYDPLVHDGPGGARGDASADAASRLDGPSDPVEDAGPAADGGLVHPLLCSRDLPGTVALFTFDGQVGQPFGASVPDVTGGAAGTVTGTVRAVPGPSPECGQAAVFGRDSFVEVAGDARWARSIGAIDFWVRASRSASMRAILGRDERGTNEPGHLTIFLTPRNRLVVRMQGSAAGDETDRVVLCSDGPLGNDLWTHVGLNFGAPEAELWIDGKKATAADDLIGAEAPWSDAQRCGRTSAQGLEGNSLPAVLGGSGFDKIRGMPPSMDFADGVLDHVRLSSVRRAFAIR